MPLTRIDMPSSKTPKYRAAVADVVQEALHAALGMPLEERFQVLAQHVPGCLAIGPSYLGVSRSPDTLVVQVFLNPSVPEPGTRRRSKAKFYAVFADGLHARLELRQEDTVVSLVEVGPDDWSFGNGEV